MNVTRLTVYGQIAPKGSRTLGRRKDGSTFTRPASNAENAWVETVARQAMWTGRQIRPGDPPYRVGLTFYFARPARPSSPYPSKLDLDKCARAVLDGLVQGGLLVDDRHVTELVALKTWAESPKGECCLVEITEAAQLRQAA